MQPGSITITTFFGSPAHVGGENKGENRLTLIFDNLPSKGALFWKIFRVLKPLIIKGLRICSVRREKFSLLIQRQLCIQRMRTSPKWLTINPVILSTLVAGSCGICRAQAQSEPPNESAPVIVVSTMPVHGTFFSMQLTNFPPLPINPYPDFPLYTADASSQIYYYDDRSVDYSALQSAGPLLQSGPPSPPGLGSGGTNGSWSPPIINIPSYTVTSNCEDWQNYWLIISNTGTSAKVGIESTLPGTAYYLLTNAELNTANWGILQTLVATSSLTWASPFSFTNSSTMFFKAAVVWPTVDWSNHLVCGSDQWGHGVDASPALSLDGSTVYIASTGNRLYALNASTGAIEESSALYTAGGTLTSSAAISSNGEVYIGSTDGFLYAFTTNLNYNWSNNLQALSEAGDFPVSVVATPAVTAGGAIYAGIDEANQGASAGTGFFSFKANSNENWFFMPQDTGKTDAGDVSSSSAVGTDGTTYFLSEDWRLYALSPSNSVKWFLPIPAETEPDSSPAIATDGSIVVGSGSPYVYSVNPDGSLKWVFHVPNTNDSDEVIYSSPVIDSSGTVYVGAGHVWTTFSQSKVPGGVYAIYNGNLVWSFTNVPGWIVGSCALGADGTVYAGAASTNHTFGMLYAISNGVQEWAFQTDSDIVSSPVICSDGGVIFSCEDSNVYKVAGCTTLAESSWPMFHHDPQHTGSLAGTNSPNPGCEAPFPNNGRLAPSYDFTFSCVGSPNTIWSVYASTNLTNWTKTGNVTLDSTGLGEFTDLTLPASVSNAFYFLSNGCCSKVIGFVQFSVMPGSNLIADPLCQVDDNSLYGPTTNSTPMNTVGALFCGGNGYFAAPGFGNRTTAVGWTDAGFVTNTSTGDRYWHPNGDIALVPGASAFLNTPTGSSVQGVWFIGLVRESVTNQIHAGTNYLASALPIAGGISSRLGYTNATSNDVLLKWNPTNQTYATYTNNGGTNWYRNGSRSEPYIGIAEGFILYSASNHAWVQTFSPCSGD